MMIAGAALVGLQLAVVAFGPGWKIQAVSLLFMGWGFYMIHGCLQVFASELSVEARASALSLHSFFFFMGQTMGPIAYGFGIEKLGKVPTLLIFAAVMVALGFACARLLRQTQAGGRRGDIGRLLGVRTRKMPWGPRPTAPSLPSSAIVQVWLRLAIRARLRRRVDVNR